MPSLQNIFELCRPRPDVISGTTRDEQFAADLAQVVRGVAPPEYSDPAVFFERTYPTAGLKALLRTVCQRLSGKGGEAASLIRLHTQFGGGKTHSLIALVHAARGMPGVPEHRKREFLDPALLPAGKVRVAGLDGENSDPANGLTLEGEIRAYSLWGEMAYQLAGIEGYRRVAAGDRAHIAPGAETIRELFGAEPTLILIDEVAPYLRKVERAFPGAAGQFTAFLQALFKAVDQSPNAAVVYTLAIGRGDQATDAYKEETERALAIMAEAEKVSARQATQLNPTEEKETAAVLRTRLFEHIDEQGAASVIDAYLEGWDRNRDMLTPEAILPERRERFLRSYPFHPELLALLTEKTASLSTFQRTRGMLRLLTRTVHLLWKNRPADAFAIHPHHMDPGFGPIRDEVTVRLEQKDYVPALIADIAAEPGAEPALAQQLDAKLYAGSPPVASYVARTIFWHTLAYGESAKGVGPERLRYSICSPALEPAFIEQARLRFIADSIYLDDRPGAPMRFMVEPNLKQIIRRTMNEVVKAAEVRAELRERIGELFGGRSARFQAVIFPAGPYEVPDEVGDGRPLLVVMNYEAVALSGEPGSLPGDVENCFLNKAGDKPRELRNNLVFVVADERLRQNMLDNVRRRLALYELRKPERMKDLAEYQQREVEEMYKKSRFEVAVAILQCYRNVFYPSQMRMPGTNVPLAHTVIELPTSSEDPGHGQTHVERVLREQQKVLSSYDQPNAPAYVRDRTPLKTKGEMTTLALRNEFRRAPELSILLDDQPLVACIQEGIKSKVFIYREGNQVWGPGDPSPVIQISENAVVHTMADAEAKKLWPRPEPLVARIVADPSTISVGGSSEITVTVTGGVPPYTFASGEPGLNAKATHQAVLRARVSPPSSASYEVEVLDSKGSRQTVRTHVFVTEGGELVPEPKPPKPVPRPAEFTATGPLGQALSELWEKARASNATRIQKLYIKLYEASATWKVHQGVATVRCARSACQFEASLHAEGIEKFEVRFEGSLERGNTIKSLLEPLIRAAQDHTFEAQYTLEFDPGLPLRDESPEKLTKDLTRYGGGEAYVEAHAAPPEEK
jgi:hypothetical protein